MYITKFLTFSKTTFLKSSKNQATKQTKWTLLTHVADSKSVTEADIYSITKKSSLPLLTLPPTKYVIVHNGVWIGKVVKEVLPPQSVAGEEASSVWAS